MKKSISKGILLLFLALNFNNIAFAQLTEYLSTNPISFLKSPNVLEEEKNAKKFHVESVTLIDYKGKLEGNDTIFDAGRIVYTMTFTKSGNILTEKWSNSISLYWYDKEDRLYKINYYTNDSTLLYYDSNNNLVCSRKSDHDSLLYWYWSRSYTYNSKGKLEGYKTYRVPFTKTEKGLIIGDSIYCGSFNWTYDEKGRILKVLQDSPFDISKSAIYNYEYFENGNTKVSELTSYKFELTYDSCGNEISYHSFFEYDGSLTDYKRDKLGNLLVKTIPRKNKSDVVVTYKNVYGNNGLLLSYIVLNSRLPDIVNVWKISYTFHK